MTYTPLAEFISLSWFGEIFVVLIRKRMEGRLLLLSVMQFAKRCFLPFYLASVTDADRYICILFMYNVLMLREWL